MEADDLKGLPFHNSYRVMGQIFVPVMGLMLLSIVWIHYRRSTSDLAALNAFSVALPAVVVGLAYFKLRSVLVQIEAQFKDQLKEKQLAVIWNCVYVMPVLGYLACIAALTFAHQH
jgi:uncharacterized membrane protein YciS (DUF1049 family)